MTHVRIRHYNDTASYSLGDVPFDQLDEVIPMLERWGLEWNGAPMSEGSYTGQFIKDGITVVFEVVLEWGDDE